MAQGQPSVHVLPLPAALPHKGRSRLLVPLPPTIAAKLYVTTVHAVVRIGLGLKVADLTMHPAGTGVVPTVLASERTFGDLVRPSGLVLKAPDHPSTQEPVIHLCEHGVLIFHSCE